jgi:hypothetical protein
MATPSYITIVPSLIGLQHKEQGAYDWYITRHVHRTMALPQILGIILGDRFIDNIIRHKEG